MRGLGLRDWLGVNLNLLYKNCSCNWIDRARLDSCGVPKMLLCFWIKFWDVMGKLNCGKRRSWNVGSLQMKLNGCLRLFDDRLRGRRREEF